MLKESTYQTPCGTIYYWSSILSLDTMTLVFLPGLTADHRLFDKQVEHFVKKYNIIVWDAPAHASSWPFRFEFDLFDKAKWLNGILEKEEIIKPIIIGQSMGGYVGQAYAQIAGHGFRILAEAMEKDLPYEIKCPSLLICGTKDRAGSCIRYNRAWHQKTKIPLKWIEGAGHNSNTNKPEMINSLLEEFLSNIL